MFIKDEAGHISFPISLPWAERARFMARERVVRFIGALRNWSDLQASDPALRGHHLVGGRTRSQVASAAPAAIADTRRPGYTAAQRAHFVQADIADLPVREWPDEMRRRLGATADSPEAWNQGVDKSVDAVQARYIERMDSTGVDEAFVRGFLDDVIAEIVKDREAGRFQYGRMDPRDVQSHLDMFKRLKDPEAVSAIASGQPLPAKFLD